MQPAISNSQSPSEGSGVTATGLVASDLEGTLTTGETWRGVGRYLRAERGPWTAARYRAFFAANTPGALLARRGVIDEQAMRLRWMRDLARFFRGFDTAELGHMAEWVVEHELWPKRREAVIAELATHRAAGQRRRADARAEARERRRGDVDGTLLAVRVHLGCDRWRGL